MANPAQQLADVITLPARTVGNQAAGLASSSARTFRSWTANEVDDWGRDNAFVNRVWSASQVRWSTSVGGAEHLPKREGALIVINARRFSLAPIFASLAIGAEIDRRVRFVGRTDVAPLGPHDAAHRARCCRWSQRSRALCAPASSSSSAPSTGRRTSAPG